MEVREGWSNLILSLDTGRFDVFLCRQRRCSISGGGDIYSTKACNASLLRERKDCVNIIHVFLN